MAAIMVLILDDTAIRPLGVGENSRVSLFSRDLQNGKTTALGRRDWFEWGGCHST